jgi:hypothetical protein
LPLINRAAGLRTEDPDAGTARSGIMALWNRSEITASWNIFPPPPWKPAWATSGCRQQTAARSS